MTDELKDLGAKALESAKPTVDFPESQKEIMNPSPTEAAKGLDAESLKGTDEPTPEEAEAIRAQKKKRVAQVLTRGVLNAKLDNVYHASVPSGRVGKFIRDDFESTIRYTNLGYSFEYNSEAVKLHGSADGHIRVGDVVLMTISQEDREILREVKREGIKRKLGAGRKEYTDRAEQASREGSGTAPFDESVSNVN